MPSNDLCFLGACEQEQLIRSKKISVTQLITAHLDQVERFNPTLNAIVTLTAESALQAAKEADAQLARQDAIGALHGLPVAHKDLFLTKGVKTTFGSPIYKDNIPQVDSLPVERQKNAGAISLGKTNTPKHTKTKANKVPILVKSVIIPLPTNKEGIPTIIPVMMVEKEGV